ncbi:MAG: Rieske 2Fe-2S domain-containing protein [Nocardioides sp.]|jgi:3-ketosteroid 9alpha-monooxygenase subunit A
MAKSPLCMTPTGWFQVAWSDEIETGQVHRMKYFGQDLIAWRANSGKVTVMDAYCQHLGAHLGYGGTVTDNDTIQCPFHGWEWNDKGRNTCIPYESRPNIGKKIKTYPTTERNEAIYMWHDTEGREPFIEVPDVFTDFDGGLTADDYFPARPGRTLLGEQQKLHPQYVVENGVDFAHFKYVHKVPIIPEFTRHDFDQPTSYVDFTITFDDSMAGMGLDEVESGVNAINGGIGISVTRSWGMFDHRTATSVTPVDDETCDIRFSVWVARSEVKTDDVDKANHVADKLANGVIEQVQNDLVIWTHQKYADPAALSRGEFAGFTALRKWAEQFYPESA